ncbi:hypothetical protein BKA59DRAFT_492946 [Fusarium tricinctum]|uniref:Uncharacterized protein n=1 Tax=Fusarium tricinctum TaxID=61284 RepID=A0A8K0WAR9_9HYPO|nr:hypothetical protein BKA59DRAFT_492946 [Fusarium tricinctum]
MTEMKLIRKKKYCHKVKTGCLTCSDAESQAIYQFRTRIASLLASPFDVKFWTHDVLQSAESFIPVRHALVGLASAYQKSVLLDTHSPTCDRFIFRQYDKAIRSLYSCFQDGKVLSTSQRSAALVANFLFMFLCSLQGLRQEAIIHLRNGLALIQQWVMDFETSNDEPSTVLMIDISRLYIRLDTQSRIICQDDVTPPSSQVRPMPSPQEEQQTFTVCQALTQLEIIHNEILQLPDPQATQNLKFFYYKHLWLWDLRFQRLASTSEHHNHITALRMRREVVRVTLLIKFDNGSNEWCIDTSCKAILDLAHQLIKVLGLQFDQVGYHMASGLVEALYFVAVTSKDWDLRQQAIDTLRRYRFIDGIWGSEAAADLASCRLQSDIYQYRLRLGSDILEHSGMAVDNLR